MRRSRLKRAGLALGAALCLAAGCGDTTAAGSPFADWQAGPWGSCQSGCSSTTPVQLAAGSDHTCGRMADGTVRCWGDNVRGQLLGGSRLAPIAGLAEIIDIAAGSNHSCALRKDGAVFCWGNNTSGQLGGVSSGAGTGLVQVEPSVFRGQQPVRLYASVNLSCALLADTSLACWGDQSRDTQVKTLPGVVGSKVDQLALAGGVQLSCVRYKNGDTVIYHPYIGEATSPVYPTLSGSSDLAAGGNVCLAVMPSGELRGFAFYDSGPVPGGWDGQLPVLAGSPTCAPQTFDLRCVPATYPSTSVWATNVKQAAVSTTGAGFACLVYRDGTVGCWGHNESGQQGNGTTAPLQGKALQQPIKPPVLVAGLRDIESLVIGRAHSCALDKRNQVFCWGSSEPLYPSSKLGNISQTTGAPPSQPLSFSP